LQISLILRRLLLKMKHLKTIQYYINQVIDWVYPFFRGFIPKETFKYAFCGGSNTMFDIVLYFITYNFILAKSNLDLYFVTLSPHIAAFLMVFPVTFSSGFLLSKYITFTQSQLKGRIQLFRYGLTVLVSIGLNYVLLKLFVDVCKFYPTPSKLLTTGIVVFYSYFSQRHFTFRKEKEIIDNYSIIK
jgi:putative flippase GtrA